MDLVRQPQKSAVLWLILLALAAHLSGCAITGQLTEREQDRIAGRTYVITGASSGIGRGVATKLAAMRANVVLAARRTDLLEEVAAEVRASGGAPLVVTTDVSKPEDIQRLMERAVAQFGRIDVWINNAGVGAFGRFEDIPLKDHARIIDVNLKGVIYGSHVAMRRFRNQGYGTLINIGSMESEIPQAYQTSYAASKAAVLSLGRTLNEELRLGGLNAIKVATVLPWVTDTPFFEHAANYTGHAVRLPGMDEPQKVVDSIVWTSLYPREEVRVGWKAKSAYAAYRLFPDLTERINANIVHEAQIESMPPAPSISGNLHVPMSSGRGVDGGFKN